MQHYTVEPTALHTTMDIIEITQHNSIFIENLMAKKST